jgi:hypothetical protein
VLILKVVKVVYFDALLQVLILNDIEGRPGGGGAYAPKENLFTTEVTEGAETKRSAEARGGAQPERDRLGWPKPIKNSDTR